MTKVYRIGPRFNKIKYLSVAVNCAIVFMFYFIYRYVFGERLGAAAGWPLALAFLLFGFLVAFLTLRIAGRYAAGISYSVTDRGLIWRMGKKEQIIAWSSFTGAKLRSISFSGVHPVDFTVDGKNMMLNQYIQDLCLLTGQIFDRIEDHVEIDPALRKRTRDLTGVY